MYVLYVCMDLYERVLLLGNFEAQGLERFGSFVVIPKYTYTHYCNNYHLCMYVCMCYQSPAEK